MSADLLAIFGIPISGPKANGGSIYCWVGYELNLAELSLGVSERRAEWLLGWFARILARNAVGAQELAEVLGRMQFVYGALPRFSCALPGWRRNGPDRLRASVCVAPPASRLRQLRHRAKRQLAVAAARAVPLAVQPHRQRQRRSCRP